MLVKNKNGSLTDEEDEGDVLFDVFVIASGWQGATPKFSSTFNTGCKLRHTVLYLQIKFSSSRSACSG